MASFLKTLLKVEQWITFLAFLTMVCVLGLDIFGRQVIGGSKIWATPIAIYGNLILSFIGLGLASAHGAHLRPRFLDKLAPTRFERAFARFPDSGFALFCLGAAALCVRMTKDSIKLSETDPVLQWQVWPFQAILVLAFLIATTRHTLYAIRPDLAPAQSGGENAPPTEEQIKSFAPAAPAHSSAVSKEAAR